MQHHVRTLGWLFIIYSAFLDFVAILVLIALGSIGAFSGDRQAFFISGAVAAGIAIILLIISLPGLIAGAGLLKYQQWARILALVLAVLHVLNFPFGTALSIYAFWVLLNSESAGLFK